MIKVSDVWGWWKAMKTGHVIRYAINFSEAVLQSLDVSLITMDVLFYYFTVAHLVG